MFFPIEKIHKNFNIKLNGVIHVGAHDGSEVPEYIQNGIEIGHLFEPIPTTFAKTQANCIDTSFKCYNVALGNNTGEVEMFVDNVNLQSCSILEPALHLQLFPDCHFPAKQKVPLTTLDKYGITDCNFLNIDTQGYELEVLKGSEKTLQYIDVVYTEVNRAEVYKNCAQIGDIHQFLHRFGFIFIAVDWWENSCWGDALFYKIR